MGIGPGVHCPTTQGMVLARKQTCSVKIQDGPVTLLENITGCALVHDPRVAKGFRIPCLLARSVPEEAFTPTGKANGNCRVFLCPIGEKEGRKEVIGAPAEGANPVAPEDLSEGGRAHECELKQLVWIGNVGILFAEVVCGGQQSLVKSFPVIVDIAVLLH